ncbi:hypothetical protein ES703_26603 [subsurface metagenome]
MHLGRDRPSACPRRALVGPELLLGKFLGEIFDDGERIPHRDVAIDQDRHLAGGRDIENALLVGSPGIERDERLLERDVAGAQRQPWPHRPGRIVLVADDELQSSHEGISFFGRSSCHRRQDAFNLCACGRGMPHVRLSGRHHRGRLLHAGMDGLRRHAGAIKSERARTQNRRPLLLSALRNPLA